MLLELVSHGACRSFHTQVSRFCEYARAKLYTGDEAENMKWTIVECSLLFDILSPTSLRLQLGSPKQHRQAYTEKVGEPQGRHLPTPPSTWMHGTRQSLAAVVESKRRYRQVTRC